MKKLPVSLILPTFNEKENLEIIIPEIVDLFENIIETNYEILVVDDSSNDGTDKLVNELSNYKISYLRSFQDDIIEIRNLSK